MGADEHAEGRAEQLTFRMEVCSVATPEARRSEHHGPPLRLGLLPGVGDTIHLQPGRVEQGQQTALVARLQRGLELASADKPTQEFVGRNSPRR